MQVANASGPGVILQTLFYLYNTSSTPYRQTDSNTQYHVSSQAENPDLRCYGIYGCFNITSPWTSPSRPVSVFPEMFDPKYMVFTQLDDGYEEFDLNDPGYVQHSKIDPDLPIFVITHGFMESGHKEWLHEMRKLLMGLGPSTTIVIDWSGGSGPLYTQAVANIRLVGSVTALVLHNILEHSKHKNLDHVHAIGHSLGAHLCGYIGYDLQKRFNLTLGRITGLDPAEPHFSKAAPPVRLHSTAAKYVDVIHTDASAFIRGGLGMTEHAGHVDFWPNGGTNQPGCVKALNDFVLEGGSFFQGMKTYLGCNHVRSYKFFIETIKPKDCPFIAISCSSFEDFKNGLCFSCEDHVCLKFGYHSRQTFENRFKRGNVMLPLKKGLYSMTGDHSPFCRSHYRFTVKVSASNASIMHGGEIGQLRFAVSSGLNGTGQSSGWISLGEGQFHAPNSTQRFVLPGSSISSMQSVSVEWKYKTSVFNPLTWRLMETPRVYIDSISIDSLELRSSITVCPENEKPVVNGKVQVMLPSYCTTQT